MMLLEVDPNLVRPGWTPLLVIVVLGIVLFFLGRSMLKQFGRIDVPADHPSDPGTPTGSDAASSDADSSTDDVRTPPVPERRTPTGDGGRAAPPDQR